MIAPDEAPMEARQPTLNRLPHLAGAGGFEEWSGQE
jgi:hypothetical protein